MKLKETSNFIVSNFPNCIIFTPLTDGHKLLQITALEMEVFNCVFNNDTPEDNLLNYSLKNDIDIESLKIFKDKLVDKLIEAGAIQYST